MRRDRVIAAIIALLGVTAPLAACTAVLGIDSDYRYSDEASGGEGGAGGSAVEPSTGARPAGEVRDASRPDAGPASCPEGQKLCFLEGRQTAECVPPDPSVGCGLGTCDACSPAPPGGFPVCSGNQCDFVCHDGYERVGDTCEPLTGGGGSGGAGGTTAGGACTMDAECPACGSFDGCCSPIGQRCGCLFVAWCQ